MAENGMHEIKCKDSEGKTFSRFFGRKINANKAIRHWVDQHNLHKAEYLGATNQIGAYPPDDTRYGEESW